MSFRGTAPSAVQEPEHSVPLGAFLGSDSEGVQRIPAFQQWLGSPVDVGHTYLPGVSWSDIEGAPEVLWPWLTWKRANPEKLFVLNVPMLPRNEARLSDRSVAKQLAAGARGDYDRHFRALAAKLTSGGAGDAILAPGWEMNGNTYTSRCFPNPDAWRAYWRRIVTAMRAVPGARFRFDFTTSRGLDAIPWTRCYPGDDVVDIIGTDSYDQPAGADFDHFVTEPYGLADQANFGAAHGKPLSFPEWGLFRNSDDPDFVKGMHHWITTHRVVYQTITDYCPHGVWRCGQNPRSSATFRKLFGPSASPTPTTPPPTTPPPTTPPPTTLPPTTPPPPQPTPTPPVTSTPPSTVPPLPPTLPTPPSTATAPPPAAVPPMATPPPATASPPTATKQPVVTSSSTSSSALVQVPPTPPTPPAGPTTQSTASPKPGPTDPPTPDPVPAPLPAPRPTAPAPVTQCHSSPPMTAQPSLVPPPMPTTPPWPTAAPPTAGAPAVATPPAGAPPAIAAPPNSEPNAAAVPTKSPVAPAPVVPTPSPTALAPPVPPGELELRAPVRIVSPPKPIVSAASSGPSNRLMRRC
ncbi:glycoside hydrolase family 26 protein [Actinomadura rupiterrae]|uniref:glycoside hydrolase family 26 protein n=1 Tax=Actinomadura rupiterrae TaxID=559627 RepID=UPI0020A41E3F|nr:glycosyl hydrolase [Actinomadura rupiterrae]MCP2335163.1 hypothetical protein [Actinomadura rupiterrae]